MNAILVSVDYADLLNITLPYNRHHFDSVVVVTSPKDEQTMAVAKKHNAKLYITDAFYQDGAAFNKWKAMEQGLDVMGREGWITILDADILWPKDDWGLLKAVEIGKLYTPLRRMWSEYPKPAPWFDPKYKDKPVEIVTDSIQSGVYPFDPAIPIHEQWWDSFPIHRNVNEWAGYSQTFHADDPVLRDRPWLQQNWIHAGGADSFFQRRWTKENKVRPPFECLHLGGAGENWMGRVAPYLDGAVPDGAEERRRQVAGIWAERKRQGRGAGFGHEKLKSPQLGP